MIITMQKYRIPLPGTGFVPRGEPEAIEAIEMARTLKVFIAGRFETIKKYDRNGFVRSRHTLRLTDRDKIVLTWDPIKGKS